jgi:hypothetical protein
VSRETQLVIFRASREPPHLPRPRPRLRTRPRPKPRPRPHRPRTTMVGLLKFSFYKGCARSRGHVLLVLFSLTKGQTTKGQTNVQFTLLPFSLRVGAGPKHDDCGKHLSGLVPGARAKCGKEHSEPPTINRRVWREAAPLNGGLVSVRTKRVALGAANVPR